MIAGEVMPVEVGGGSSTYYGTYYVQGIPASGEVLRTVNLGGDAYQGALAGLSCLITAYTPGAAQKQTGTRLVYILSV
ncbi:MAG: hypothetical protein ACOYN4_17425 [Bacteroidales bacterium]